jgi:tetratricopeptide (TPR) repeat protein
MRKFAATTLAAVSLVASEPAAATWYRASSEHFLIYSEQKPQALLEFAQDLEKFDGAVRVLRGMQDLPPSEGNRITIFTLPTAAEVQRLYGDKSGFIDGFYKGSAAGSVAYVARGDRAPGSRRKIGSMTFESLTAGMDGETILLHEYSHHLMMQDLAVPYPEWLVEGFAEFMATAQFEKDGTVGIGLPDAQRYYGLLNGKQLPLETLLSGKYDKITEEEHESIYGRGWLLTHYLTFEPSRKGQLRTYLLALAKGADPLQAARDNFGDLKQLERDLERYMRRSKMQYLKVSGTALNFAPIQMSEVSAGGAAVMPLLAEIKNGVSGSAAEPMAQKVRAVERLYPGDELVETTLAQAELDARHFDAAEAAADRAIRVNARNTEAMVLKGQSIMERAEALTGNARHDLFEQARNTFIAANKIDAEDPEPLADYYEAYAREGRRPTDNAIAALHYASDLAPQDLGLRMNSALAYLQENKPRDARQALIPIAYDPHGGDFAKIARAMMERIDAGDSKGALAAAEAPASSQ